MAPPPIVSISSSEPPKLHASDIRSIKTFVDTNGLSLIPSSYYSIDEARDDVVNHLASSIPAINFSLLTSDLPQLHVDAISQLGKAGAEWGFFMVMNHGISEKLMEKVVNKAHNSITCRWRKRRNFETRVPGHPSDTTQASPLK